jgi:hypothetical protein
MKVLIRLHPCFVMKALDMKASDLYKIIRNVVVCKNGLGCTIHALYRGEKFRQYVICLCSSIEHFQTMCFGITISTLVDPLYCLEESKNVLSCSVKGNSWFSSKKNSIRLPLPFGMLDFLFRFLAFFLYENEFIHVKYLYDSYETPVF